MDLIAKGVKHITYPLWIYKNRSLRLNYLKEFEKTQFLSPEKINELQWQKLKRILKHAYENCAFYRERFDNLHIKPNDIKSYEDFIKFPILTKTDIQENLKGLVAKNYSEKKLIKDMTGGSTGSPLVFYYDKKRLDSREAATIRHNRWTGWDIGDKVAALWGAARDVNVPQKFHSKIREHLLRKKLLLDASSITEEKMFVFAKKLKKFKPKIILAYANTMYLFARFLKANNISGINPKAIICTAEVLLPENRKFIENVFGCEVFNRYGCREVMMIASECEFHSGMHINTDSLYVEFIRQGKPVGHNEVGEIIITDLLNYSMPLIRYEIGDMGKPLDKICQCGRGLPMMNMAEGRTTDFIISPEGKIVSGVALATYVITNIKGIKQVQFIQEKIDRVKVKLVKNKLYTRESESKLLRNINKFLGTKISFQLEFVDNMPKEISGKYRFTISKISKEFWR